MDCHAADEMEERYRAPFAISLSFGAAHPHMSSLEVAEVWL